MGTYYQEAKDEVAKIAESLMRKFHPDLVKCDVSITFLFAFNSEGPAITHNGWPAKALVKVTTLRDRVAGLKDALVIIDGECWKEWPTAKRIAIVDHELTHLVPRLDRIGNIKYDDANRPKLFCRLHDFQFGGFDQMVERYGGISEEAEAVLNVVNRWEQLKLPWTDGSLATAST